VLNRQYALAGELLDLVLPVVLPVLNVWVGANAEWSSSENDCADVIVPACGPDSLLMRLGCASLLGKNEAGTDPDTSSAECEHGSKRLAVVHATSGDDENLLAGKRRLVALDHLDGCWDEDGCGYISSVASTLTTLCADHVDTEVEALLDVLGVSDHVHVQDAVLVELLDDVLGGYTDGADEELGARVNDDINELVELALGIIVADVESIMQSLNVE
jgi:hypothetical protein